MMDDPFDSMSHNRYMMSHWNWSICTFVVQDNYFLPQDPNKIARYQYLHALRQIPPHVFSDIFRVQSVRFDLINATVDILESSASSTLIQIKLPAVCINDVPVAYHHHNDLLRSWETMDRAGLLLKALHGTYSGIPKCAPVPVRVSGSQHRKRLCSIAEETTSDEEFFVLEHHVSHEHTQMQSSVTDLSILSHYMNQMDVNMSI